MFGRRRRREPEDPAAAAEAERVAEALEGELAGRRVDVLRVPGSGELVPLVAIEPQEVRDAWWAARPLVERVGRRPVAVAAWGDTLDGEAILSRKAYGPGLPAPGTVAERARSVTFEQAMERFRANGGIDYDDEWWAEEVDAALEEARERVGDDLPSRDELLALERDPAILQARLLEWEEARAPTVRPEPGEYLGWFEPTNQPVAIAFLPATAPEEVAAYLDFWGADFAGGHEALIAVLRAWHARHGAEVVASWGTMLQLAVARPPTDLDEAFALAVEQDRVAFDTLMGRGVSLREHARALLGRREWFLHSRP